MESRSCSPRDQDLVFGLQEKGSCRIVSVVVSFVFFFLLPYYSYAFSYMRA